jgi:hypothetical protein
MVFSKPLVTRASQDWLTDTELAAATGLTWFRSYSIARMAAQWQPDRCPNSMDFE